jgi:hypothetical protein
MLKLAICHNELYAKDSFVPTFLLPGAMVLVMKLTDLVRNNSLICCAAILNP